MKRTVRVGVELLCRPPTSLNTGHPPPPQLPHKPSHIPHRRGPSPHAAHLRRQRGPLGDVLQGHQLPLGHEGREVEALRRGGLRRRDALLQLRQALLRGQRVVDGLRDAERAEVGRGARGTKPSPSDPRMVTRELSRGWVCWLRRDQHNEQHMRSQKGEKSLSRAEHGAFCKRSVGIVYTGTLCGGERGTIIDICSRYRSYRLYSIQSTGTMYQQDGGLPAPTPPHSSQ